jgi:hypothetical protein
MTEDQAKTKWCFMSRFIKWGGSVVSNQPIGDETPDGNCIGSRCMAWRWSEADATNTFHGFCGLISRPD